MFVGMIEGLTACSSPALDEALAAAELDVRRADLRVAAVAAVIAGRQSYRDHGHISMKGYLKQQLNCSGVRANRIRRRAALVDQHGKVGNALLAGRIGTEQADRLANALAHPRASDRFGEFEPILLEHAERLEFDEFGIAVSHFVKQADEDGAFDDQQFQTDERTASVAIVNGGIDVHASGGDALAAAEITCIFERAVEAEFRKDCDARREEHGDAALEHPLPRTARQRKFDALHRIFMASVTAPADGKRPEPLVNFVIDPTTGIEALARHGFLDIDTCEGAENEPIDPGGRRCATSTGVPVHSDVVVRAMLRGSVRRVIVDAHDVVISLGRTQRLFTGKAREAAQLLAIKCRHRGCDIPAEFCDVDHIDEWVADGGATDQENAMVLCGPHDRWKHRQRLRGRRDRIGRVHLVRPDGSVIKPVGARDPDWADAELDTEPDIDDDTDGNVWRTMTWADYAGDSRNGRRSHAYPVAASIVRTLDLRAA